ncbi:MAG TPA: hypothetical protein VEL74_21175, partial [Thermoanaerobaculia bacterium]|nr:hypothetical protein [Thermoanaerobaculia bacterium]
MSATLIPASGAWAAGGWTGGQDFYHVPLSWCIVQGTPAHVSPNVAGDFATDDLIWRRHERPSDHIYINQAGITFRSAINDIWGQLNFPIIPDPDLNFGVQGDMRGEDVNTFGAEFNAMLSSCETAWDNLGRSGIGITAVNAGVFHDGNGQYVGTIGWGGCVESQFTGLCIPPYEGVITVVDNHYLHPSVPNRTLPNSTLQFILTDPMDQLVGHELGHALSLPHRTNNTALMNPGPVDNNSDGMSDNITLNATEVNAVRASAVLVPGLEIDPPRLILPGNVRAQRRPDKVKEHAGRPAHLDLASVKVTGDVAQREIAVTQQLFGLLPATAKQFHWFLIDTDDAVTGAGPAAIRKAGGPVTQFTGADIILRADVAGQAVTGGQAWSFQAGNLVPLVGVGFDLRRLVMHPLRTKIVNRDGAVVWAPPSEGHGEFPVHHIIAATLPGEKLGALLEGKPFRVHAVIVTDPEKGEAVDEIEAKDPERGTVFDLKLPSFPHCFAQGETTPGG